MPLPQWLTLWAITEGEKKMGYPKAYLRNLLLIALVLGGMLVFLRVFYPDALGLLPLISQVYAGLNLWPFIVLALLILALPRRPRRWSGQADPPAG